MAQTTKRPRSRKTTRPRRKGARSQAMTIGGRLDAALARVALAWRAAVAAVTVTSRRLSVGLVGLTVLLVLGIGGGYWLARLIVGGNGTSISASRPAAVPSGGSSGKTAPASRPRYASIDDLPDLPKYSEAEGRTRPVFEERPQPVAAARPARPLPDAAWVRNAIAFRDDPARPLIVIVIDDMGLDRPRSRHAMDLPAPLTLSFLPYARDLQAQAQAGRAHGHELMLHLPMEPMSSGVDPGPNALLTTLSDDAIRRRTIAALDSFTGYVAVNNHMGSRFTTWRPGVETVLRQIRARGLAWLDSRTHAESVGGMVATEFGIAHVDRHVFLDDVDAADAVRHQLAETERVARRRGVAIAIGHPHDATIKALAEWLPTLRGKGFLQAPVSAALKRRGHWE
jgi:polysaccharide deacetylase 2 family uncharacterized protein YibQ